MATLWEKYTSWTLRHTKSGARGYPIWSCQDPFGTLVALVNQLWGPHKTGVKAKPSAVLWGDGAPLRICGANPKGTPEEHSRSRKSRQRRDARWSAVRRAPVAQRIEPCTPKAEMEVRFLPGAPKLTLSELIAPAFAKASAGRPLCALRKAKSAFVFAVKSQSSPQ